MNPTQIIQGVLNPDGGLELSEKLTLPPGPVRLTVESIAKPAAPRPDLIEVLDQIRKDQAARGYRGRSLAEMQADEAAKAAEDDEYEERWRQIWAQTEPRS
jgi:hypothetical protein